MDCLLRVDVEYSEKPIQACDRKVRLVPQAVDASNGAHATLVLSEHASMLGPEVKQCQVAGSAAN